MMTGTTMMESFGPVLDSIMVSGSIQKMDLQIGETTTIGAGGKDITVADKGTFAAGVHIAVVAVAAVEGKRD